MAQQRKQFRSEQEAIWQQLSDSLGGEFFDREGHRQDKVRIRCNDWTVTLDLHGEPGYKAEKVYLRLRAPYVNPDGFRFNIYRHGLYEGVAKLLGAQDIKTGFEEFDSMYICQSNDAERLKKLASNERLRGLIKTEPGIHLFVRESGDWFKDDFPEGVDELVLELENDVRDLERLEKLYLLFSETLHTLCHIGGAYEDDPNIQDVLKD